MPVNFGVVRNPTLGVWFAHDYDRSRFPDPVSKLNEALAITAHEEKGNTKYTQAVAYLSTRTGSAVSAQEDPEAARQTVADYARGRRLGSLIDGLLFVNIFWGLLNLLPVFPLDGGQIARELLCLRQPRAGLEKTLLLSTIVAAAVGALALLHFGLRHGLFFALMFGLLAFINDRVLQQLRAMGGGGGGQPGGEEYGGYEPEDWWKR
jgi:hypothetical protein